MNEQATGFEITITERPEFAMIAVQGPQAKAKAAGLLTEQQTQAVQAAPGHCLSATRWKGYLASAQ